MMLIYISNQINYKAGNRDSEPKFKMTTTVKLFVNPDVRVRITNLLVNVKDFTFQLTLGTKTKKQRNFREEVVTGKISVDLHDWLTQTFKERIKVADDSEIGYKYMETGKLLTGFKAFLAKQGIEFQPGILKDMIFESDNKSESYQENPFKIIRYLDGHVTLTLVNIGTKKVVTVEDPETGIATQMWIQSFTKLGERYVPNFFSKKGFVRLKVEETKDVQEFTQTDATA